MAHKQPRCKKCHKKMGMLQSGLCDSCKFKPKGKWTITGLK